MYYYRRWKEWNNEKGYLTDTCLTAHANQKRKTLPTPDR